MKAVAPNQETLIQLAHRAEHEPISLPWLLETPFVPQMPQHIDDDRGITFLLRPEWVVTARARGGPLVQEVANVAVEQYFMVRGCPIVTAANVASVNGRPYQVSASRNGRTLTPADSLPWNGRGLAGIPIIFVAVCPRVVQLCGMVQTDRLSPIGKLTDLSVTVPLATLFPITQIPFERNVMRPS